MYKYPYTLWSIWPQLSTLNRLFVLVLASACIYSVVSAVIVMKNLHTIARQYKSADVGPISSRIAQLHARCANLRQILGTTFYLFGFLFFVGLQNAPITLGDGPQFPIVEILNNFVFDFVFAANVFFVLLILHLVQWLATSRVRVWAQRLGG